MRTTFLLTLGACSLLPLGGLRAQTPAPSPAPSPSTVAPLAPLTDTGDFGKRAGKGFGKRREMLQSLSPEDRQKLVQARQKAMSDPAVEAAKSSGDPRAAHKAMRDAMLRADPTVAPLLGKMHAKAGSQNPAGTQPAQPAERPAARNMRHGNTGGGEMASKLAFLPEDERTKLRHAYTAANSDAQVTSLQQQRMSATTPEAKTQTNKAYREAVRNAMLRNDPSIAPILQKVHDHQDPDAGIIDAAAL